MQSKSKKSIDKIDDEVYLYSILNFYLVDAGYRTGAIVKFIPNDRNILYTYLPFNPNYFLILYNRAPDELKELLCTLPDLYKNKSDLGNYHISIGKIIGYTEPRNLLNSPDDDNGIAIIVKGTYKQNPVVLQIAPQRISPQRTQEGINKLEEMISGIRQIGPYIPGFQLEEVFVGHNKLKKVGGRLRKTRRKQK